MEPFAPPLLFATKYHNAAFPRYRNAMVSHRSPVRAVMVKGVSDGTYVSGMTVV